MSWAEIIDAVATALEARRLPDADGEDSVSLLAAVTGSVPPGLRRRLRHQPLSHDTVNDDVEPLIYQNEFGVHVLAEGIVDVAAQAVAGRCGQRCPAVTAIVAVAALSTLRLEPADKAATRLQVHRRITMFGAPPWTEALDGLASRTAELNDLLTDAADLGPGDARRPDPGRGGGRGRGRWRCPGQRGAAAALAAPVPPILQPRDQRGPVIAHHHRALARDRIPARAAYRRAGRGPGRAGRG